MASQPVANCGNGLKSLGGNNTLLEINMSSVTQSTMKTKVKWHVRGGHEFDATFYGFTGYDGTTTHVAIVYYEGEATVYQIDPEHTDEALAMLESYLCDYREYDRENLDIALHIMPPAMVCN